MSGISEGHSLLHGHHRACLAEALVRTERKTGSKRAHTFMFTGSPPMTERGQQRRLPEVIYTTADGTPVYELFSINDPLWELMRGAGDAAAAADALISGDLSSGQFVEDAAAGRILALTVHSFTLNSNEARVGFRVLETILSRLRERFGKRLTWLTSSDLCRVA